MLERFLKQTSFESYEDFMQNYEVRVPANFNFAYDVVDAWAETNPSKRAMLWTNEDGEVHTFTFHDLKEYSDRTASYFQSIGIGKGDVVMLILKRRYEWWLCMLALHKLGAIVVPATHLLRKHDIEYRSKAADILGSICGSGSSSGEGNGNPLQYSCLEKPMDRGAWWATVLGLAKSWIRLGN